MDASLTLAQPPASDGGMLVAPANRPNIVATRPVDLTFKAALRWCSRIILHTWNQLGEQHLHTHTVLPGGGWLRGDGPRRFVTPPDASWLQPAALMQAFRDALLRHPCRVAERDTLVFARRAAFLADPVVFGD